MATNEKFLVATDLYLKSGIHIGTKFKTKHMEKFIYKTRPDGLSVLNLQKIKSNTDFNQSSQVKISRRSVQATILTTRLTGRSNILLTWLFKFAARGLHKKSWQYPSNTTQLSKK